MEYIPHPNKSFMAKFDRVEPILQDSTGMKTFKECDRKYFYRIVLGFAPRKEQYQTNLDWGSVRHKFREVLEQTQSLSEAMKAAMAVKIEPDAQKKYLFMLDKRRLLEMLNLDFEKWEQEKAQGKIKVLYIEQPINVQLPDGTFSAGRIDQGVEWAGQIWDRDFKTSSKDITLFAKQKDPDDQATRYIYMLSKLHGKLIGGIIFDVIQNTDTIKSKPYNHLVTKTQSQLNQWEKEQVQINRQLAVNRQEDLWPMKEHNCAWCPFTWVCRMPNETAQMAKLESDYVKRPWDLTKVGDSND